jgi:hypothetical protein
MGNILLVAPAEAGAAVGIRAVATISSGPGLRRGDGAFHV